MEGIDMATRNVGRIRAWFIAICIASSISAQPAFAAELTGPLVYLNHGVHLSKCDRSRPLRLQLTRAYPQVAAAVFPRKSAVLNALSLTVLIDSQSAAPQANLPTDSLRVTQVVRLGSALECNITGKDRPLVGTLWSTPLEP